MYGEKLGKDADMGDYIKEFQEVNEQFKGKSKEKRKRYGGKRNEDMDKLKKQV